MAVAPSARPPSAASTRRRSGANGPPTRCWRLRTRTRSSQWLLAGFGSYPTYFRRLREVNRLGPRVYGEFPVLAPLDVAAVERLRLDGAEVIDGRPIEAFAAGHIPGSLSIALRPEFGSWLGWLAPFDRPLVFVLGPGQDRADLVRQALGIGYEQLAGELAGGIDAWRQAGRPVAVTALTRTPSAGGPVLDVRQASEFRSGHVRGANGAGAGFARRRRHRCPRWGHGHVRPRRASDDRRQPARTCWSPCLGLRRESRRLGACSDPSPVRGDKWTQRRGASLGGRLRGVAGAGVRGRGGRRPGRPPPPPPGQEGGTRCHSSWTGMTSPG